MIKVMKSLPVKMPKFTNYKIPFFILLFISFASAILGDSTAEALILSNFDSSLIPRMFMVNAFFLFMSSIFIISIIDRIDRGMFFMIFMIIHSIILFAAWVVCSFGITFLFIPLFSYSYITKILLFLMFWTLANDLVDSRSAGRDFPFIAAGGTLGAIFISFIIPWMLKIISVQNLLLGWVVLCFCISLFFLQIRSSFKKYFIQISDREKHRSLNIKNLSKDLTLVNREPLLANMSLLYFLIFFLLLNQHYSFYDSIKVRFVQADKLAGFLGYFNGISMLTTFIIQIAFSGFIIKKLGSSRSMFILPLIFCFIFGTLAVMDFTFNTQSNSVDISSVLFWCIVIGVGLRIAFFDSFFSPNFQIFFSSLPQDIRGRGKLVIEGIIKPSAMVFAGLWLIFIANKISFGINALIMFFTTLLLILVTFRIRVKYAESLIQYLSSFKSRIPISILDSSEISVTLNTLFILSEKLKNESYDVKCYIIELLAAINTEDSIKILTDYIPYADQKTRATIISSLTKLRIESLRPLYISMLQDSDNRVVANIILALAAYKEPEVNEGLHVFLHNKNNRIKANAVIALWPGSNPEIRKNLLKVLEDMLDSSNIETCSNALYAIYEIASIKDTGFLLECFYNRKKSDIISSRALWKHFLNSIFKDTSQKLIKILLDMSNCLNSKMRNDIAKCIAESCNNGYNINNLMEYFKSGDTSTREIILKILCIQNEKVNSEIDEIIIKIAEEEKKFAYKNLLLYHELEHNTIGTNIGTQLLSIAIMEEIVNVCVNNLVLISAILDKSGSIKKVMNRLSHENKHVKARALEVLDNVGNMEINGWLLKLIDICADKSKIADVDRSYLGNSDADTVFSIVMSYKRNSNEWIRRCAEFAIAMDENKFEIRNP